MGEKKTSRQKAIFFYIVNNSLIVTHFYFPCRCTFKNIFNIFFFFFYTQRHPPWNSQAIKSSDQRHSAPSGVTVCHCSRVTTSTAWPSSVTVFSMRVATGAMATWTGRLPWARLVTTVWYMLTGIWTRPWEGGAMKAFYYIDSNHR